MKNIVKRAAVSAGIVTALGGVMALPASAASSPASICGAGYYDVDSNAVGAAATVYLEYNNDGHNCVVTMLKHPDGKRHDLGAYLQVQGYPRVSDVGSYTTYAGPVRQSAKGKCVQWSGYSGIDDGTYVSPYEHCH